MCTGTLKKLPLVGESVTTLFVERKRPRMLEPSDCAAEEGL